MSDISSAELLEVNKPQSNVLSEFVHSALQSGIVSPLRGAAQIADHASGSSIDKSINNAAEKMGLGPSQPAETGTANWVAQTLGGAAGMVVPFMLTRGAVKATAGKVFGEAAVNRSASDLIAKRGLAAAATHEGAISAATGLAYGTFLTPSNESNIGTSEFVKDRVGTGAGDALIFGSLGFGSTVVNHSAGQMARLIEKHALTQQTAMAVVVLDSPMVTGAVSGLLPGALSAELSALKNGRLLPTTQEVKDHTLNMAFVGGAFGTVGWLSAQRPGTNMTNARYFTDSVGLTTPSSARQVDFRVVEGKESIARITNDIAGGAADAQASVLARPQIDTVASALFGPEYRSYGDTRTVVLDHRSSGTLTPSILGKGDVSLATCASTEGALAKFDLFPGRGGGADSTVWLRTDSARPAAFSVAMESIAPESAVNRGAARVVGRTTEVPLGSTVDGVIASTKFVDLGAIELQLPRERNMFYPDPSSQFATDWFAQHARRINHDQAAHVLRNNGLEHQIPALESAMTVASYSNVTGKNSMRGLPPQESVLYARQQGSVVLYDQGRNILVGQSSIKVETPSPSGQQTMVEFFDSHGNHRAEYEYFGPPVSQQQLNSRLIAVTQNGYRYLSVDGGAVETNRRPFLPPDAVVDSAVSQKPVDVVDRTVDQYIGQYVNTPRSSGWLVGFDPRSAEAIVSFDEWAAIKGFDGFMGPVPAKAYPIELAGIKGQQFEGFRDSSGRLMFANHRTATPRTTLAASSMMAIKPSEVTVHNRGNRLRLSTALGLAPTDGLRAAGGYWLQDGSRLKLKSVSD